MYITCIKLQDRPSFSKKKKYHTFYKRFDFFSENNYRLLIGGHHLVIVKMLTIQNDIFVINFALTAA